MSWPCVFCCRVINATTGVLVGGGRRNRIHSNLFLDNDLDIAFDNRGMSWMADYCTPDCTRWDCFHKELEGLDYTQPPYSTRYPELVNIYDNHPGVPINNVIEDNRFCHQRSLNISSTRGFVGEHGQTVTFSLGCTPHTDWRCVPDQNGSTVLSWMSTMSNNRLDCSDAH